MRKLALLLVLLVPLGGCSALISPEQQAQFDQLSASVGVSNSYLAVLRDLNQMRASGALPDEVFVQVDPHVQSADLHLKAMMAARRTSDDIAFQMSQRQFNMALEGMVYWRNRLAGGGI